MIKTLDDAWKWYDSALKIAKVSLRLGQKHWSTLKMTEPFWKDDRLFYLSPEALVASSRTVIEELDDLCILLLFSVFESRVRNHVLGSVKDVLGSQAVTHPALSRALTSLEDDVSHGSFYRVFDPYKSLDFNLAEEVNQIRRFRNWVAHGRRGEQPSTVLPQVAYQSLGEFLHLLVGEVTTATATIDMVIPDDAAPV